MVVVGGSSVTCGVGNVADGRWAGSATRRSGPGARVASESQSAPGPEEELSLTVGRRGPRMACGPSGYNKHEFDVWWVDLSIRTGPDIGYTFRIRDQKLRCRPLGP